MRSHVRNSNTALFCHLAYFGTQILVAGWLVICAEQLRPVMAVGRIGFRLYCFEDVALLIDGSIAGKAYLSCRLYLVPGAESLKSPSYVFRRRLQVWPIP